MKEITGKKAMYWRISSLVKAFLSPSTSLGDLDAGSVAALVTAASDVALVVDKDGIIRDLAIHNNEISADLRDGEGWVGRPFSATVAHDSKPKVEALLRDANQSGARWRHVNHLGADGASIPVLYSAVRINADGRAVVFGRDMRALSVLQQRLVMAQQSMEQDYSRLRDVEMRYRLLFQMSSEAVLILDTARLRVTELNPAAQELFGGKPDQLVGRGLSSVFTEDSQAAVLAHLEDVRQGRRAEEVAVRLADDQGEATVSASLFREGSATLFLLRVSPATGRAAAAPLPATKRQLLKVVENAPDGFVVTDGGGHVVTANAAFLEMAGLKTEGEARGESLERWIGQSGVDLDVLLANLRQRDTLRHFLTTLRSEDGGSTQVEISAVAVGNGAGPTFGFAIRNVAMRMRTEPRAARELPRSVEQLTELIGRVSLKDLVREATDVIEKLCIEAALELTGDNRASAAEMLGLSRQSLYVKLRKFGLGDLAADGQN
jgi:transcriptional regulator PpsR